VLARIENNSITEIRNISMDSVPAHKRSLWRTYVKIHPEFDSDIQVLSGPVLEVDDNQAREVWTVTDKDLDEIKAYYKERLSNDAEIVRLKYITPGDGKMLAYVEIKEESLAISSDTENPVSTDVDQLTPEQKSILEAMYPLISAEIPFRATSYQGVAVIVQAQYSAFRQLEKSIIATVNKGNSAIEGSTNVTDVKSAYASITWAV
jgi:hypothetical protein